MKDDWREIIGVVADEYDDGVQTKPPSVTYWPVLMKNFWGDEVFCQRAMTFAIRSKRTGSLAFLDEIRHALWSLSPNSPAEFSNCGSRDPSVVILFDGMTGRRAFLKAAITAVASAPFSAGQQGPPKSARITSGVMVWTLKGTFEEKLATVAQAGIQSVELVSEHLSWSEPQAAKYKSLAQSYGLGMDALLAQHDWTKRPVTMVNPAHRDAFLQEVRDSITWAKRLDIGQIIVMSGNVQPDMSHEAQYASIVEGGKRAAEIASESGVKLILEPLNSKVNHKGYFLTSAKEGLQAVKEVDNPHFRLLFDIYHEYVQNGDPIPTLNEAVPYVAVFHVADAPGRHDPGTGEMKWDEIYKAIGKSAYAGYITFEYLPQGDQVESLIKAVTQMRKDINASASPTNANS